MLRKNAFVSISVVVVLYVLAGGHHLLSAQSRDADVMGALRYRYIGPVGNRLTSVVGIPGDPNTYYVGAAS